MVAANKAGIAETEVKARIQETLGENPSLKLPQCLPKFQA